MAAFEHVVVLLSFVYALALTHLLSRIVELFDARARVKFSGLQAAMAVMAIMIVFLDWLALWPLRKVTTWDFLSVADNFALGILLFFTCAIAAPRVSLDGPIDLEDYYWHARRPFYWLYLAGDAIAALGNLDFLKSPDPSQFWIWTPSCLLGLIPPAFALASKARWAQWTAAIAFMIIAIVDGFWLGNLS
jgi:hypothetical protein